MSEPIYRDPAALPSGGVGVSAPAVADRGGRAHVGLPAKIAGRWWLIAACLVVALVSSFAYLVTSDKVYTASSVISADMDGRDGSSTPAGDVPPDEFLFMQRDVIASPAVVASAATTLIQSDAQVRNAMDVAVSKGEGLLTIRYNASRPDAAARGANAVAEAYLRARSQQVGNATAGLAELAKQREKLAAERTAKEAAVRQSRENAGAAGGDAERVAAARIEQLQQAVTAAEVELTGASAAAAAGGEMLADPQKLRHVIEANRNKGIFDRLESQRNQVESELSQLGPQLEKQKQSMLPQHPVVVATQRKIDQLNARLAELDKQYGGVYLAHLEQQRATAQKKVDELKLLVDGQSALAKDYLARAAKLAGLEAELKKTDAAIAEVDRKIRDATLDGGASAAPTVRIVMPAQPPSRPSRPDRSRTLLAATAIGLAAGLGLAAVLPGRRRA